MVRRAAVLVSLMAVAAAPMAAELFTLDRDPLSSTYTGPTGPLVLSGDILAGDYDRLLTRIAENPQQFLATNRIIVSADEGDVTEAIRIGELLRAMLTQVDVGPLTGPCSGPCFLIYAAAARRGADGAGLLGLYAPPAAEPEERQRVIDFLTANQVPSDLLERLLEHTRKDPYWLSEPEEQVLGPRSAAFEQKLREGCGWTADLERSVFAGDRPMQDLRNVWTCAEALVRPAARQALCWALAERDEAKKKAASAPADQAVSAADAPPRRRGAAPDSTHPKQPKAAKKSTCNDPRP
ncbi:MAG TPA: hypothetical protein VKT22_10845 [Steroidobacteraceae bacterium]|nr:hypothetical protein [Steroidobacteraceae bacterium]